MKHFYAIAAENTEPHEFEIKYFGDKMKQNIVTNAGYGRIGIETKYKPATDEEYDMRFREAMYLVKPIHKVKDFLDYQLSRYIGEKSEFLDQIRYVILPRTKKGKPSHADIIEKWLESKEEKTLPGAYTIQMGDVHAPLQIQQNSNHSSQHQKINYSPADVSNLFDALKLDIEKLDKSIREDFDLEINYAVKQLQKDNDVKPQLLNIGKLIKSVGLPIFTNLVSSGAFEAVKPFLGID